MNTHVRSEMTNDFILPGEWTRVAGNVGDSLSVWVKRDNVSPFKVEWCAVNGYDIWHACSVPHTQNSCHGHVITWRGNERNLTLACVLHVLRLLKIPRPLAVMQTYQRHEWRVPLGEIANAYKA